MKKHTPPDRFFDPRVGLSSGRGAPVSKRKPAPLVENIEDIEDIEDDGDEELVKE